MDTNKILRDVNSRMVKAVEHTTQEFRTLHTGKASPAMVETLHVDAYGSSMRLQEVAAITTPDARTIAIQPWDKEMLRPIEKAIQVANIGLNPIIQGSVIRCPLPELSRERRQELVKTCQGIAEEGRVAIRTIRRDSIEAARKSQKAAEISEDEFHRLEKEIQHATDKHTAEIGKVVEHKEKELMQI